MAIFRPAAPRNPFSGSGNPRTGATQFEIVKSEAIKLPEQSSRSLIKRKTATVAAAYMISTIEQENF
jgi:hypothetical protein